ncbi:MAG: hypothetical protein ACE5JG_09285 [Planctomycetota bacterium]
MGRLLVALLLLPAAATAREVPITPEALELMPGLWPGERRELWQKVEPLFEQLRRTGEELERLERDRRRDPTARERERGELDRRFDDLVGRIEAVLRDAGLDDAAIERLERMPRGRLRAERYAHRTVLEAPDLTAPQRALLQRLVLAVDAAQAALAAYRERVEHDRRTATDHGGLPPGLLEGFERQVREIDRRWWRIVGLVLTVPQRAAIRRLYPPRFSEIRDLRGHIFLLEGLTPSQATRVNALFSEYESESAADRAEMRRLETGLRRPDLDDTGRAALEAKLQAAAGRHEALVRELMDRGRQVLTPQQNEQLQAVTPLQSAEDRSRHPGEIVAGMDLRPGQRARLERLGALIERAHQQARREARRKLDDLGAQIGEESPQAMMMQMTERGARATVIAVMERAAREALLEVLDADQVVRWAVSPGPG